MFTLSLQLTIKSKYYIYRVMQRKKENFEYDIDDLLHGEKFKVC